MGQYSKILYENTTFSELDFFFEEYYLLFTRKKENCLELSCTFFRLISDGKILTGIFQRRFVVFRNPIYVLGLIAIASCMSFSGRAVAQEGHYASSYLAPAMPDGSLSPLSYVLRPIAPPEGLVIEMSVAPPVNVPTNPYDLGKYGRITVDYSAVGSFEGSDLGVSAQALHVAHHLLFYSAGLSCDINEDGMFLFTVGLAHYQTGNSRLEPFVDAPFMRLRFQSSQNYIFGYSEIETTMHFRQYLSGMAGLGIRLSPMVRIIGGLHHTEFVMPSEHTVTMVNGLEGIISWGM